MPILDRADASLSDHLREPTSLSRRRTDPRPVIRSGDGKAVFLNDEIRNIDRLWSGVSQQGRGIFEYYDYYYTGDNIKVYVDGVEPPDADANIPIMEFAFKISQQKTPIYGFWSYTYDQMLRGVRIVQGAMRIATTSTNYMTRLLSKAAEARANQGQDFVIRKLDIDEQNINEYWGRHMESDALVEKNIFSVHPPFNFTILYGIDSVAACMPSNLKIDQYVIDKYNKGFGTMSSDDNHTIIEADQDNNIMRRVIEAVEIVDMTVEYGTNGQVCSELYSFIARDHYTPDPPSHSNLYNYGNTNVPSASELPYQVPKAFGGVIP